MTMNLINKLFQVLITILASIMLTSCVRVSDGNISINSESIKPSGKVISETREVSSEFNKIHTTSIVTAYVTKADQFSIKVEADDNLIPYVETEIDNNVLTIKLNNVLIKGTSNIKVYVSLPQIKELKSMGSSDIVVLNDLKFDDLVLNSSGASNIKTKSLDVIDLTIEASGSSDIESFGIGHNLKVNLSGASDAKLSFDSKVTQVILSGSSDLTLNNNTSNLNINASGASEYKGNVEVKDIIVVSTGSSEVTLSGKALSLDYNGSGASEGKFKNLLVNNIKVIASGSSEININPVESIVLNLSGASEVNCYNKPANIEQVVSKGASLNFK